MRFTWNFQIFSAVEIESLFSRKTERPGKVAGVWESILLLFDVSTETQDVVKAAGQDQRSPCFRSKKSVIFCCFLLKEYQLHDAHYRQCFCLVIFLLTKFMHQQNDDKVDSMNIDVQKTSSCLNELYQLQSEKIYSRTICVTCVMMKWHFLLAV